MESQARSLWRDGHGHVCASQRAGPPGVAPLRQRYSRHIPSRVRPGVGLSELRPLQVVLIISGNLSFLNWLTMVPSVACFDDATLGFLFPSGPGALKDRVLKLQEETARGARPTLRYGEWTVSFHISLRVAAWE